MRFALGDLFKRVLELRGERIADPVAHALGKLDGSGRGAAVLEGDQVFQFAAVPHCLAHGRHQLGEEAALALEDLAPAVRAMSGKHVREVQFLGGAELYAPLTAASPVHSTFSFGR